MIVVLYLGLQASSNMMCSERCFLSQGPTSNIVPPWKHLACNAAEAHGGRIGVGNESGMGRRFVGDRRVKFPRSKRECGGVLIVSVDR